jgi:hypothetical protein
MYTLNKHHSRDESSSPTTPRKHKKVAFTNGITTTAPMELGPTGETTLPGVDLTIETVPIEDSAITESVLAEAQTSAPRRSKRIAAKLADTMDVANRAQVSALPQVPTTYKQAITSELSDEWVMAMEEQVKRMADFDVFEVASKPRFRNIIPTRWVYAIKKGIDNTIKEFKASGKGKV